MMNHLLVWNMRIYVSSVLLHEDCTARSHYFHWCDSEQLLDFPCFPSHASCQEAEFTELLSRAGPRQRFF